MRCSITEAASLVLLSLCVGRAVALPLADNSTEPLTDLVARATGDSAADPILKELDCTDSNAQYPGIQELFDADCYVHVCGQAPVILNRWDQSKRNRGVEFGNGVGSRQIFVDLNKYKTKRPGKDEISPEEWPPASTAQGGQNAILIPVTRAAQDRQKVVINNKFYAKKPVVAAQKGVNGSKKGSWFRITKFNGAKGPYCQALNDKLANYAANFDSNGRVKTTPAICKPKAAVNLNGLAYDVGLYSYQLNPKDRSQYLPVLKAL